MRFNHLTRLPLGVVAFGMSSVGLAQTVPSGPRYGAFGIDLTPADRTQSKEREDAVRARLTTDSHAPFKYRLNGVVRNIDAWYTAFIVKPGDAMYLAPAQRIHIW